MRIICLIFGHKPFPYTVLRAPIEACIRCMRCNEDFHLGSDTEFA